MIFQHHTTIDSVSGPDQNGEFTITIKDVTLTMGFLIEPKVGDHVEVNRSPLVFSALHKNVVLHSEARIPEGTKIYSKDFVAMRERSIAQHEEAVFVGTTYSQWEDQRGDVHRGIHRFLVRAKEGDFDFPLLDVDRYWTIEPPLTGLDHILMNWESGLV